jgi:ABC-type Zn uptake system ZnuABC Zn-binding protein ZnuA
MVGARRFVALCPLYGRGESMWRPLAIVLVLIPLLAPSGVADDKLRIVTTTTDLRSLVEAVGGERVAVTSLVPPNLDPEEYQPKPHDITRLKDARIAVKVGLDYDLWFDRLLTQASLSQHSARELRRGGPGHADASAAIATLDVRGASVGPGDGHAHGSGNPHYWLDPKNAEIITGTILETLARVDPANAGEYEANRLTFLDRLDAKLREWDAKAVILQGTLLIGYHNSWAYFARRFRLDFVGFIEPRPGVPPSPAHLAGLIRTMRERAVRIIVRQPHEPEKNTAFLAQKTGATVLLLAGSVGATPAAKDYLALFDANLDALLAAKARP